MEQSDKEILLNPLSSVKSNGILGFQINDSMEDVFSRGKSLNLMSDDEIQKQRSAIVNFGSDVNSKEIVISGDGKFEEISRIVFSWNPNREILDLIMVQFKPEQNLEMQIVQIREKVSFYLKRPDYNWRFGHYYITLDLQPFRLNDDSNISYAPALSFNYDNFKTK